MKKLTALAVSLIKMHQKVDGTKDIACCTDEVCNSIHARSVVSQSGAINKESTVTGVKDGHTRPVSMSALRNTTISLAKVKIMNEFAPHALGQSCLMLIIALTLAKLVTLVVTSIYLFST